MSASLKAALALAFRGPIRQPMFVIGTERTLSGQSEIHKFVMKLLVIEGFFMLLGQTAHWSYAATQLARRRNDENT